MFIRLQYPISMNLNPVLMPTAFAYNVVTKSFQRSLRAAALFLFIFITASSLQAQHLSQVKVFIPHDKVAVLREAGIDFDHGYYDFTEHSFTNSFINTDIPKIAKLGFRYTVLVENEAANYLATNKPEDFYKNDVHAAPGARVNFQAVCQSFVSSVNTPAGFISGSCGGFYNWTEMQARMDSMVHNYPAICSKTSIGTTYNGLPIYMIKISDNVATDETTEPEVLYTGLHHAREGMSGMNLIFFMQYLLENYASNSQIKEIIDSRQLYFVPVVNVDGYNFNTTAANWSAGKNLHRKNLNPTNGGTMSADGSGGYGVDLNRNFPKYWGYNAAGSSTTVTNDAYRGPSALSEPETNVMRNFINGRRFNLAINYHCYGNWWIRPNGPVDVTTNLSAADISVYTAMANLFTKYNGFVFGNASQTVYEVNGYSDDWLFSDDLGIRKRVFAFSPEIGSSAEGTSASGGFWALTANIIPIAKKMLFSNLQIAYTAGGYGELQDNSDIAVTSTTGSFGYTVTRKGLVDTPITVTLIPLQNIATAGSPVTITSIPTFLGTSSNTISYTLSSGIATGAMIKFVWKMDIAGITRTDTVIKYYNPTTVFSDDMETAANFATKWTTAGTSNWSYASSKAYAGTKSLSQSGGSNYAVNSNETITTKTAMDLSSSNSAYLSFWMRYDAENQQDRLQMLISTNGVGGTFSPICGGNTITETYNALGGIPSYTGHADGWSHEIIDLTSYTNNNNVALRFQFISGPSSSEVTSPVLADGFFLDNIKVVKSTLVLLPVTWVDVSARKSGTAAIISWETSSDNKFDHYEIQRSSNGEDFTSIGTAARTGSSYVDNSPLKGDDYYRLKAVDIDGSFSYSKTMQLSFNDLTSTITYYPNPVKDVLNVVLNSTQQEPVVVEVSSLSGQTVYAKTHYLAAGSNHITIGIKNLSNQVYILKIKDSNNNVKSITKILKQ